MLILFVCCCFIQHYTAIAGSYDTIGAPIIFPSNCSSFNCTLNLDVVDYRGPTANFSTRGFNGEIPGPTIYAKAGETLTINFNNHLLNIDNPQTPMNSFRAPNTSNLHTHGLHVSSQSPSDDIFVEIQPDESFEYVFHIPDYHQAGTHWYHPHHHGSTALQAGGGAFGLLIIEDAEDEVPPIIANMENIPLILSWVDIETLVGFQEMFNRALWQVTGSTDSLGLINGQFQPTVDVRSNVWYRLRILFAAVESKAYLEFEDSGDDLTCEMQLLAKDGVYLRTMPREISMIYLFPGSRADVAVRCDGVGTINMVATDTDDRRRTTEWTTLQGGGGGGGEDDIVIPTDASGVMFSLRVTDDGSNSSDLPYIEVNRPCYMANTLKTSADVSQEVALGGSLGFVVNGEAFQGEDTYINEDNPIEAGQLVELEVSGMVFHPFHFHVHPFQIQSKLTGSDSYFSKGDWHDTLQAPSDGSVDVKFFADSYIGKTVIHCHVLAHEDQGMMAVLEVGGTEGSTYANVHSLEPGCYFNSSRGYSFTDGDDSDNKDDATLSLLFIILIVIGGLAVLKILAYFGYRIYMHLKVKNNEKVEDMEATQDNKENTQTRVLHVKNTPKSELEMHPNTSIM